MDMETEDSDLLQTRPCVVVHLLTVTLIPALKVEVRKAGFQSQSQPQESLSLKGVERGRGGILISSCVGEEVVVYPDSQFLAWATWVLPEIAEEDPGDGLRKD